MKNIKPIYPEGDFYPPTSDGFRFPFINVKIWKSRNNKYRYLIPVISILSLISTTNAIKCYICGQGADAPFLESRQPNINRTFVEQKVHKSCDEFDRIPLEEKYKYEMNCPEDFVGCMLNVGGEKKYK